MITEMIFGKSPVSTVVIPVYNGEKYLRDSLLSVADHVSDFEFEVLVLNDGSTDNSLNIAREFERNYQNFKVVDLPKSGLVAVLNQSLGLVNTPLISRHDADDLMLVGRLQSQIQDFQLNSKLNCVGGQITLFSESKSKSELKANYYPEDDKTIKSQIMKKNVFASPTVTYCRFCAIRVGGYRSCCDGAEDYDLWLRLTEFGLMKNDSRIWTYYRVHPEQVTQSKTWKVYRSTLYAKILFLVNSKLGLELSNEQIPECHRERKNSIIQRLPVVGFLLLDFVRLILFTMKKIAGKK